MSTRAPDGPHPTGRSRPPAADTVGDVLRLQAEAAPDAVALSSRTSSHRWTYAQLWEEARLLAGGLLRHHRSGEVLATCSVNRAELVVFQFAAALAGMPLVAINPSYGPDELGYVLGHSRAVLVLAAPEVAVRLPRDGAGGASAPLILDPGTAREELPVEAAASRRRLPDLGGRDVAQVQYTSGTTDRPKAAVIRHRAMTWTAAGFADRLDLRTGGAWINPMPLFHTAGNVLGVLGAATAGAEQVLVPFAARSVLEAAVETGAEVLGAAPTMLHALLAETGTQRPPAPLLRVVYTGGATLEPAFVRRVERGLGVRVSVGFGMTETCGCITMTRPTDDEDTRTETSGRELPGTEVTVVDPSSGVQQPVGVVGEIWVRGERVTPGYLDAQGQVAAALDDAGSLHTGDLGALDADGRLRVTGRIKDMIKSGGENVSPAEVEACLATHPAVSQVCVIGVPDPKWGEVVTAFVRLQAGDGHRLADPVADLDAHCRRLLAPHKRPRLWHLADELPVTASGKVRKESLRDLVRGDRVRLTTAPRTPR